MMGMEYPQDQSSPPQVVVEQPGLHIMEGEALGHHIMEVEDQFLVVDQDPHTMEEVDRDLLIMEEALSREADQGLHTLVEMEDQVLEEDQDQLTMEEEKDQFLEGHPQVVVQGPFIMEEALVEGQSHHIMEVGRLDVPIRDLLEEDQAGGQDLHTSQEVQVAGQGPLIMEEALYLVEKEEKACSEALLVLLVLSYLQKQI